MTALKNDAEAAARALIDARQKGRQISSLPGFILPMSMADAYLVQDAIIERNSKSLSGWKVGATSAAVMKRFNTTEPFSGPMFTNQMHSSPTNLKLPSHEILGVEAEFSFWMTSELPPRDAPYQKNEVLSAIGGIAASIEVVASRLKNASEYGISAITADHGVNFEWVRGNTEINWRALDLTDHEVRLLINDNEVATGIGGDVLGCPLNALVWLTNHLSKRGHVLTADTWVSSGSCTNITPVCANDCVVADFGTLGTVILTFIDAD